MSSILTWWRVCRKTGCAWVFDGDSLGGIWITCAVCGRLEEFLPGLHEPEGGEVVWQERLAK